MESCTLRLSALIRWYATRKRASDDPKASKSKEPGGGDAQKQRSVGVGLGSPRAYPPRQQPRSRSHLIAAKTKNNPIMVNTIALVA